MTLGKKRAANPAVVCECRTVHTLHGHCALHVAELANVVIALVHRHPAEQWIAYGLQGLLIFHHTLPLMRMPRGVSVDKRSHAGPSGLLELEKKHVVGAIALKQRNERSQSDA